MNDVLAGEFERLRLAGRITLDEAEAVRHRAGESTLSLYLARHALAAGPWIEQIQPAEFGALHRSWCDAVESRADCILAICEKGLERTPALSLRLAFDPAWYRRQADGLELLAPAALYRHYLAEGSEAGLAPSEGAALVRIWGNDAFPSCFDWEAWRNHAAPDADDDADSDGFPLLDRAAVLADFLDSAAPDRSRYVAGPGCAHFLAAMAERAWRVHGRTDEARALFTEALGHDGPSGWIHHLLGDLARDLGDPAQALVHYRAGIAQAAPNRWSHINAARLLLAERDWRSALEILREGAGPWQETAPWRTCHDLAMHLWSQDCTRRLNEAERGAPPPADLFAEVDALARDIAARLPKPHSMGATSGATLLFSARPVSPARQDMGLIAGLTVLDLGAIDRSEYLGAMLASETVIFHEAPFTYEVQRAMLAARRLGKRVIVWLGDLAEWEGLPLEHALWGDRAQEYSWLRRAALRELALVARFADQAITTLAGALEALCACAPDVPRAVLASPPADLRGRPRARRAVLVAPGGLLDNDQLAAMAWGLVAAGKHLRDLHFLVTEDLARHPALRELAGRWSRIDGDPELPLLARLLAEVDLVAVPSGADWPYAISAEARARGVPALDLPPDADTGTAVANALIDALSAPPPPHDASGAPSPACAPARTPPADPATDRPRILMVNVWAPPQQFGGAARIFCDNIDYYLDHHRERFTFAAFASDEYNEACGQFTVDTYRGIPVFRVATPIEPDIYWRGASAMAAARFGAVLDAFRPDLVHFHCLQRLTASLARECRRRGVRYIVTMHDGWWLSDFVFVSEPDGRAALPARDWFDQRRGDHRDHTASILRSRRLRETLLGAERRLAESPEFGAIYAACGIPCEVVANGISRIAPAPRAAPGERVELCHIGGLEPHKGAYLVEAALRQGNFANLSLSIVDLDQNSAFRLETRWGSTPVTIIGRIPADRLSEFYARMNVLMAPSVWPESFGLVSREALAHGLWVVAGNRGAMGSPVVPGTNGFVVPVEDVSGVAAALAAIDADPGRYQAPPPRPDAPMRTADDQARDLIAIYADLTARSPIAKLGRRVRQGWTALVRQAMPMGRSHRTPSTRPGPHT
ncbi:glycosyltransferase [Novosphingobium bradum]|uniref:Glycosyltransferase n=1 Tax=Novosphingobium bradum TaxID=1737444 RepID=A0ABV7ISY7_9SPHN